LKHDSKILKTTRLHQIRTPKHNTSWFKYKQINLKQWTKHALHVKGTNSIKTWKTYNEQNNRVSFPYRVCT